MTKHFKRPLSILLAVMMVVGLFSAIPMTASAAQEGVFTISDNGTITYCSDWSSPELVVPETIAGITVKRIGSGAFDETAASKITFQSHIEYVSSEGFYYCQSLAELVFEQGVDEFADYAIAGTSASGFKLTINESTNTVFGNGVIQTWASASNITIACLASNTGARSFQTSNGYNWEEVVSGHTHSWTIDSMTCTAEDKDNITVNLVCADDSTHTTTVSIDNTEFTVVSTTDATCTSTGTMVINTNFIYDGQTIAESNKNVTISAYEKHDYSLQKWTWWDNSLIAAKNPDAAEDTVGPKADDNFENPFYVYCSHCDWSYNYGKYSLSPSNFTTSDDNGFTRGNLNATGRSWLTNWVAPYGTLYSDDNYAYYTDTAPIWEWAEDYSYATVTFDDGYDETDSSIFSEIITDTTDGDKQKIRYVATVYYRGNVYHSARKVDVPPEIHTITWKNDDGTVINTTTVEDGVIPTHADAVKASTAEYDYTFAGWTPTVVAATADAEYTATFTAVKRSYTITWLNDDDSVIDTTSVEYGTVPTHADATKAASGCTAYTFDGWTPEVAPVTGEATYKATFTESESHTYTAAWYWTENQPSYTAALRLTCSGCGDEVVLSGDDISYEYNPYCTSYNGLATTYTASVVYEGETFTDTKTVSSYDSTDIINRIPIDGIMEKLEDGNQFGLNDSVYYRNAALLGAQEKGAIETTDGQSQGTDIRFIGVVNSDILENARDYGFMVATSGQGVWNTDKAIGNLTAESFPNSKYSCKDTDNTICGDYGKRDTDTAYKYVTVAVNGVNANQTIAARFYIQDENGVYHYAEYTNDYCKSYRGIALRYSDLG